MDGPLPFKKSKLRDRKGDLSKRWYIEFYAYSHEAKDMVRKQVFLPSDLTSAKERKAWAKPRMQAIDEMLEKGYSLDAEAKASAPKKKEAETCRQAFNAQMRFAEDNYAGETVKSYRSCINPFMQWLADQGLAGMPITELKPKHIHAYLDGMASKVSAKTVNNHLSMLKAMASRMKERALIESLFTEGIKLRKEKESPNTPFDAEQKEALENWMRRNRPELYIATRLIYYAFIRPIELTRLKVGDIDLDEKIIRLSGENTKNGNNANIPMTPKLVDDLEWYGLRRLDKRLNLFSNGRKLTPGTAPLIRSRISEAHADAMKACGIKGEGLSLYTWKDTGVVNAYKAGIDMKTLQNLLRHHSVAITEIYLRALGSQLQGNIEGKEW